MNTRPLLASLCAALGIVSTAAAQTQQRYYPQAPGGYPQQPQYSQPAPPPSYQQPYQAAPQGYGYSQQPQPQTQYESPIQFLPKFGKRMSEMVRRLFYGQDPTGYDNQPQGYGLNGGYSLDATPRQNQVPNYPQQQPLPLPGSQYQYPQQQQQAQPRYNYPPQQQPVNPSRIQQPVPQTKSTTPAPSTPSKSSTASSTRKYTPPKVNETPVKTPSKSSATTRTQQPATDSPPPTTTRRSESAPEQPSTASSSASGSFLKGKKTAKPGRVISPYPPYKELDITGLESGSLALDPTTQKVFEVP
ncbi:MAG: hypothetical protein ACKVY0_25930 [Prosthecobacter sp.]|uniref:hypothetical protein n=1 Tax=Prosthecobacter sp. TaxID=1965333 RepID=UPI003900C4AB